MNSGVNQTVAVVDYGMGNLRSVAQAVIHATQDTRVNAVITADPAQVRAAHRVVLPGQGAMADCMRELRESGLLESLLGIAVRADVAEGGLQGVRLVAAFLAFRPDLSCSTAFLRRLTGGKGIGAVALASTLTPPPSSI